MYKSKNYDMATQVAMDKLMPKPIQISISMKGGGGLSSISEPIIRRFMGGYTDEHAGVYDVGVQDDPTLISTPDDPEDLATSKPGSSIRHGTRGWTKEGAERGVRDLIDNYGENVVLPIARLLGLPLKAEYSNKQPDMLRTEPGRDEKTLTSLDLGSGVQSYLPGYGGKQERIDLIREQGLYPGQANKIQDALREKKEAEYESERQRNIPERYRHSFRTTPLSRQPRSIRNLPVGFATGGGLSSMNKPITINGQRHNLAWINSDESSVLKAMGGSGKPGPMGIPSYEEDDPYAVEDDSAAYDFGEEATGILTATDIPEQQYGEGDVITFTDNTSTAATGRDGRADGEDSSYQELYDRSELNSLKTQLIGRLGGPGMEAYMKGLGKEGLREVIGKFHTGWDFGGDLGTAQGISRGIGKGYEKDLDLKTLAKKLKELKEENLSDEEFEKAKGNILSDYQGIAKDLGGKFIITKPFDTGGIMGDLEQTLKDRDMSPHWATAAKFFPGQSLTKAPAYIANAITNLVGHLGTFTTEEGKEFSLRDTGKLIEQDMAAIPTEDSPEPVTEIARAVAPSPEVVAEAGPMETFQAGLQSIESNEGIENSIQILMNNSGVSESEARRMLGLDVNIA